MKRFICGAVCGAVLTTAIGAGAAGIWDKIDVLHTDVWSISDYTTVYVRIYPDRYDCSVIDESFIPVG